ncbi:MAG: hypothetical protein JWO68_128 [Actinomycetia bacterium]|nr:hypothetical protein [Actinomycetes bacterium]
MARGIALIVAAIVLGVVLLRATDSPAPVPVKSTTGTTTATTPGSVATGTQTTGTTTPTTAGAGTKAHNPTEVAVLVANGSRVKGAAAGLATKLKAANYLVKPSVNTKATASASVVYYDPGYQADAQAIANTLNPKPAVQPMPDVLPVADRAGAQVLVVIAADLASG